MKTRSEILIHTIKSWFKISNRKNVRMARLERLERIFEMRICLGEGNETRLMSRMKRVLMMLHLLTKITFWIPIAQWRVWAKLRLDFRVGVCGYFQSRTCRRRGCTERLRKTFHWRKVWANVDPSVVHRIILVEVT